jgi:hypothetical protein
MLIRIDHLPGNVTEEDVRLLCNMLTRVESVCLSNNGNQDNVLAWISIDANYAVGSTIAWRLDGTWWNNRHPGATLSLVAGE